MRIIAWILAALLLIPSAESSSYSATYDLGTLSATVWVACDAGCELTLPNDAEIVNSTTPYVLEHSGRHLRLVSSSTTSFYYSTSLPIEKSDGYFFVIDLSLIPQDSKFITVILPSGTILRHPIGSENPSILPEGSSITTDGQRVSIHWEPGGLAGSTALLVRYMIPSANVPWMVMAVLAIAAGTILIALRHRRNLTANLYEDEKKIVQALARGELWQKQLQLKLGISKVKLSRKLRSLEQKGIVQRTPYGNTNRVRLKL